MIALLNYEAKKIKNLNFYASTRKIKILNFLPDRQERGR